MTLAKCSLPPQVSALSETGSRHLRDPLHLLRVTGQVTGQIPRRTCRAGRQETLPIARLGHDRPEQSMVFNEPQGKTP